MKDFVNDTGLEPGTKIYVCRRGLEGRYVGQMVIEERTLIKITPRAFRSKSVSGFGSGWQMLNEHYYMSADKARVQAAVLDDARKALSESCTRTERLKRVIATLAEVEQ